MSFKIAEITTAASVANGGTVTLPYPAGTTQASFTGANASADGAVVLNDNDVYAEAPSGVRVNFAYGADNITLTNNTGITWAAGTFIRAQLGQAGGDRPASEPSPAIANVALAGGSYAQAEVNAIANTVNAVLVALRAQGVIAK